MTESADMAEFEKQFSNRLSLDMDNVSFETLAFLKDRIADLEGIIEFRRELLAFANEQIAPIERIEMQVSSFLRKLRERKQEFVREQGEYKKLISGDTNNLEAAQRQLARLLAELDAARALREKRMEIDASTANAPWRMRAKKYQIEGAHRLVAAGRGILGDMPGLGKTLQSIMTINMLREQGKGNKVLIFTLKPVLKDFEREIQEWYPDNNFIITLNQTLKGLKSDVLGVVQHLPQAIVLTNYEVWRKDKTIIQSLINCQFDTVILDEAHVFKTGSSATFRGIREIVYAENQCNNCNRLISQEFDKQALIGRTIRGTVCPQCESRPKLFEDFRSVKNVFPMTGTPILNKPADLWAMLNLIDVKAFPDENRFLQDYCTKRCAGCGKNYACICDEGPRMRWVFNSGGSERLLKSLGMKFTRRDRTTDGVEMPPQKVKHHYFELDPDLYPKQYKFNKMLKDKARLIFNDEKAVVIVDPLPWYTRMRQAATWPDGIQIKDEDGVVIETVQIGESIIMDNGEQITLEGVEVGHRVIVCSNFKPALVEMERRLKEKNIRVARFDGSTPQSKRQEIIDDFNLNHTKVGEHKFDVLLVNYKTGSTGLNLSGAHQIVVLDREWNPGKEQQMLDRVRRLDSKFDSQVHILHCEGTGTALMDALIAEKEHMLSDFEAGVDNANLKEIMRKFLED